MEITLLGTGTSQGVPVIGCGCAICKSSDSKDQRLRTSALVKVQEATILIDAGPDFRQQMLREKVTNLDAILLTHSHRDHMGGLDDVRAFYETQMEGMPIYGNEYTLRGVKEMLPYSFAENPCPGVPKFDTNLIAQQSFKIKDVDVLPVDVMHLKLPITAYRIKDFTYITDANFISEESLQKMMGTRVLVINALRHTPHISHFMLKEALEVIAKIKPERAYITHISHQFGLHKDMQPKLPEGVCLGYDGLKIKM